MKTKTLLIVATLMSLLATSVFATESNSPTTNVPSMLKQAKDQLKADVAAVGGPTNLNEVVIGILQGVKTCSGEVYDASKSAIIQSVDFAKEQAPLVVHEFLRWKMAEACIWLALWSIPAICLIWFGRKARILANSEKTPDTSKYTMDKTDYIWWKWGFRILATILVMVNLSINGMTITKIAIAPRVFLIEYVVDTINTMHQASHN
jgi:hypothetical protein